ncbi:hypothetical protein JCM16303_005191 [Sporobolomyces ruberrimus]
MVRYKHRYISCELLFIDSLDHLPSLNGNTTGGRGGENGESTLPPGVNEAAIIRLLRDSLAVNFGDVGAGEVGGTFAVKYLSPSTSTMILRVSREHFRTLWASLTLLRKIGGKEVVTRVTHVSGTIRKIQHCAIALDREQILKSHRRSIERKKDRITSEKKEGRVIGGVKGGGEEKEVEERLKESHDKIMALEA